jgi:hypothetical protein
MAAGSSDDRTLWDLDVRPLDGYDDVQDRDLIGTPGANVTVANRPTLRNERTAPKTPKTPATRPNRKAPNRIVVPPSTAYTPGVLNCVRGSPPRRVAPKKPR